MKYIKLHTRIYIYIYDAKTYKSSADISKLRTLTSYRIFREGTPGIIFFVCLEINTFHK